MIDYGPFNRSISFCLATEHSSHSSSSPDASLRWHQSSATPKYGRTDHQTTLSSSSSSSSSLISPSHYEFPFSPPPASSYLSQNFICESGKLFATFPCNIIMLQDKNATIFKLLIGLLNGFFALPSASRLLFQTINWIKNVPSFSQLTSEVQTTILKHTWVELFLLGKFEKRN